MTGKSTTYRRLRALAICVVALAAPASHAAGTPPPIAASLADPDADDATLARVAAELARSSDLRVRIVASAPGLVEHDGVFLFAPDTMLAAMVEQARGSTDPIVLWMLTHRCIGQARDPAPPCDPVAIAERWTVADTQNQQAWLVLAQTLDLAGRPAEARAAFVRGAQASTWREDAVALGQVLAANVPAGLTPWQRVSLLEAAPAIGFAIPVPFQTLARGCRDATLRDACLRYLDAIARDADNVMALRIVAALSSRIGAPEATVTARQRRADAVLYAMTTLEQHDDLADPDAALGRARYRVATSEARRASRLLAEARLTEEDGARLFAESLTAEQRRFRHDAVTPRPDAAASAR